MIGSYIWNPTYGWFRVTAFDSVNRQITVINECFASNEDPGTAVPSDTIFVFGAPPGATQVTYEQNGLGTGYTLTTSAAAIVFGTQSPAITLTQAGTYLIHGYFGVSANALTNAAYLAVNGGFRRTNNTAANLTNISVLGVPPLTAITNILSTVVLPALFYTTANTDDILTLQASYSGTIGSGGLLSANASIKAIKLY